MSSVAESLKSNKAKRTWDKMKALCSKKSTVPNRMDNVEGGANIVEIFRSKYEKLFSSVRTPVSKIKDLKSQIQKKIVDCCNHNKCYSNHQINMYDIRKALKQLKYGKHDGHYRFYSDHLVHGCQRLQILLALLLQLMATHNVLPQSLRESVLIPIPKDKNKPLNDSKNYRAIAMSSALGKILDLCILAKHGSILETADLEFGFKHDH